ncbi:F-box domain-containing protein [Mycena kentingensis (nom. inval.)]|nr:F-box domain-containing protein [Mycena kentingensis (nom. inval.)]
MVIPFSIPESHADRRKRLGQIDAELYRLERESGPYIAALEEAEKILLARLAHITYPADTLPSPILLSHLHGVLSRAWARARWRQVALNTPELWSSMDVDLRFKQGRKRNELWPGNQELFDLWMKRGGDGPLSLTIRQKNGNRGHPESILPNYISPPFSFLRRFEADISPIQFRRIRPLGTPSPLLESLAAAVIAEDLDDIMQNAPNLRELRLRKYPLGATLASPILVKLEITSRLPKQLTSLSTILDILVDCPALEEFATGVSPLVTPAPRRQSMKLENLRVLGLPSGSGTQTDALIAHLTLPRLQSLDLVISNPKSALSSLTGLVLRSLCTVKHLQISAQGLSSNEERSALAECVALFRHLESLAIHVNTNKTEYPFVRADTLALLPSLSRLSFSADLGRDQPAATYNWPALLDILRPRTDQFSFRVATKWVRTLFPQCDDWLPPDSDSAVLSADDEQLAHRIRVKQLAYIPAHDESAKRCRCAECDPDAYYDDVQPEDEEEWPERETDGEGREWAVRRWPESVLEFGMDRKDKEVVDPYAAFALHPDFGHEVELEEEDDDEWDDDDDDDEESRSGEDSDS